MVVMTLHQTANLNHKKRTFQIASENQILQAQWKKLTQHGGWKSDKSANYAQYAVDDDDDDDDVTAASQSSHTSHTTALTGC